MANYLIRRLFQMMVVVILSSVAIYVLLNIAPGGPLSGLKLSADRRTRVSDADIARLEAYLGLDKPLALRYITWMTGDDWLGADWMYLGIAQFTQPKIGRNGEPVYKTDRSTGEKTLVEESFRYWVNPGAALFNPGYTLWVWGEEAGMQMVEVRTESTEGGRTVQELELLSFTADRVRVKPPTTDTPPDDIVIRGIVVSQTANDITIEDKNGVKYVVVANSETVFDFPEGEGQPRPADGNWLDISWLTGTDGILGKYSSFHGDTRGVVRLDFGFSWRLSPSQPVMDLIKSRLPNTMILMGSALGFSMLIGIPIGIYSAIHQYSKTDYAVTTFAFFGSAMPVFWFGLMVILLFGHYFKQWGLPFMPTGSVFMVREAPEGSVLALLGATPGSLLDRVVHLAMPTFVLSLLYLSSWSRFARSSMLEVLRQDYVRTARAKGLIERVVIIKHALRNALIPIVTVMIGSITSLFDGAILTETIFAYPGMGRLYFDALGGNDWPVVMAYLFIAAVLVVITTLVRDVVYTVIDPRIRFS